MFTTLPDTNDSGRGESKTPPSTPESFNQNIENCEEVCITVS